MYQHYHTAIRRTGTPKVHFPQLFYVSAILLFAILGLTGCSSFVNYPGDEWFGRDKLYHFAASGAIGAGTTAVASNNGFGCGEAPLAGVTLSLAAGAGKEWYDAEIKQTRWSWKDMVWDIIGGAAGSYAVTGWR